MPKHGNIWVTLHDGDTVHGRGGIHGVADAHGGDRATAIPVPVNERGELPVLLINPRDGSGRVIPGSWLAAKGDDAEQTTRYERLR